MAEPSRVVDAAGKLACSDPGLMESSTVGVGEGEIQEVDMLKARLASPVPMPGRWRTAIRAVQLLAAVSAVALWSFPTSGAAASQNQDNPLMLEPGNLAPFVATPQEVVDRMLEFANVTSKDVVYDLGCGDGRIVITAAKKYGARGVGVDIDPERIRESNENARAAGVEKLVTFVLKDAMAVDVSPATVVTLYLLSSSNVKLRPMLTEKLKPGARIISHSFSMGDWAPEQVDSFKDAYGMTRVLYRWIADGKVRP
jgi:SAM-dependent methyltransferase